MISINDYMKYITEKLVAYLDMTDEEKEKNKALKLERKNKPARLSSHWFGILPLSLKLFKKND